MKPPPERIATHAKRLTCALVDACNCLTWRACGSTDGGVSVNNHALAGRCILVVEDEPVIALQLETQLNAAGARVYSAGRLRDALYMAEHPALSAAVLDFRLGGDDKRRALRQIFRRKAQHTQIAWIVPGFTQARRAVPRRRKAARSDGN